MTDQKVVVVVDDEPIVGMMVDMCLRKSGYCVHVFDNPKDVMWAIDKIGFAHVLLSDFNLPGMDGLTLARRVKEIVPGIKVILMSGSDKQTFAREQSDFDDFLGKPFASHEIKAKVIDVLSQVQ